MVGVGVVLIAAWGGVFIIAVESLSGGFFFCGGVLLLLGYDVARDERNGHGSHDSDSRV